MNVLFSVICMVLVAVPITFVLHGVYQDGVFGRIGLLGIAFCGMGYLMEIWFGDDEIEVLPLTVFFAGCVAIFLTWHLARFHRRVILKRPIESLK